MLRPAGKHADITEAQSEKLASESFSHFRRFEHTELTSLNVMTSTICVLKLNIATTIENQAIQLLPRLFHIV